MLKSLSDYHTYVSQHVSLAQCQIKAVHEIEQVRAIIPVESRQHIRNIKELLKRDSLTPVLDYKIGKGRIYVDGQSFMVAINSVTRNNMLSHYQLTLSKPNHCLLKLMTAILPKAKPTQVEFGLALHSVNPKLLIEQLRIFTVLNWQRGREYQTNPKTTSYKLVTYDDQGQLLPTIKIHYGSVQLGYLGMTNLVKVHEITKEEVYRNIHFQYMDVHELIKKHVADRFGESINDRPNSAIVQAATKDLKQFSVDFVKEFNTGGLASAKSLIPTNLRARILKDHPLQEEFKFLLRQAS